LRNSQIRSGQAKCTMVMSSSMRVRWYLACVVVACCAEAIQAQSVAVRSYGTPCYFEFSDPSYAVDPGQTNALITVIRTGEFRVSVSVNYSTRTGTATAGVDYLDVAGTLLIPAGRGSATFSVPLLQGSQRDEPVTVHLTLSAAGLNGMITQGSALLTIGSSSPSTAADAPLLAVHAEPGGKVVLSWPTNPRSWALQKTENPSGTNWVEVLAAAQEDRGRLVVTELALGGRYFYRLRAANSP
jgi:hypothetical protein